MSAISDNKRIAKNTLFMYFRMLLVMLVGLYTVRVILATLGADDYGIYNVVGGVVTMFSFLTTTMVSSSQRFFAFYIGKGDQTKLNEYFLTTCLSYIIMGSVVVILACPIGYWLIENKFTIPDSRLYAAKVVFFFSIMEFIVRTFTIPYQSLILSKERMNVYAYAGIFDVFLQLGVVFILQAFEFDSLILYAFLHFLVALFISLFYIIYCRIQYKPETRIKRFYAPNQLKELFGYSMWNMFGTLATMLRSQGINMLINMFFTPSVNAARSIAFQVSHATNTFSTNFFSAVKPQITKQYAAGELKGMMTLVFRSARFSYFILLILALPILFEMPSILGLWLKEVPDYTILFTSLVIINALVDSMAHPLMTAVQATGNIRKYTLVTSAIIILNVPISYLFLKLGYEPQVTMIISTFVSVVAQISRLYFMKYHFGIEIYNFIKKVVLPMFIVTFVASIPPTVLKILSPSGFIWSLFDIMLTVIVVALSVLCLGMTEHERKSLFNFIKTKVLKTV